MLNAFERKIIIYLKKKHYEKRIREYGYSKLENYRISTVAPSRPPKDQPNLVATKEAEEIALLKSQISEQESLLSAKDEEKFAIDREIFQKEKQTKVNQIVIPLSQRFSTRRTPT